LGLATTIDRKPGTPGWLAAARVSAVGLEMGASIAIGAGAGLWLDGKLGTEPWLLLAGVGLGLAAAFRGLVRTARRAREDLRR
jgi:F0F1-type ATP synthase assembly protein I